MNRGAHAANPLRYQRHADEFVARAMRHVRPGQRVVVGVINANSARIESTALASAIIGGRA